MSDKINCLTPVAQDPNEFQKQVKQLAQQFADYIDEMIIEECIQLYEEGKL